VLASSAAATAAGRQHRRKPASVVRPAEGLIEGMKAGVAIIAPIG